MCVGRTTQASTGSASRGGSSNAAPPSSRTTRHRTKGKIMTETVNGGARVAQQRRKGGKGLKMERVFSTAGVHPYDEVTWERRDVVQQNWKTGETVFEQKGVEFPDFWSVNASTIVTTKYFRGAVGTE